MVHGFDKDADRRGLTVHGFRGSGFRVQRFPDAIGIQGFIWFPKSILEAFYERSI